MMLVMMRKIYVNTFHNLLFLLGQKPGVPGATKNSANGKSGAVKPNQLSNPLVDGGQARILSRFDQAVDILVELTMTMYLQILTQQCCLCLTSLDRPLPITNFA